MKVCCISGECCAELLGCGVTQGAALFWLCKVLHISVSQPFQKPKQEVGVRAGRVILLALFGYGEWWHWKLATPSHCTCKVGITCVHPFSAPETCCRSGAVGEPGSRKRRGISRTFCSFCGLASIEILRICFNIRQQAGSRGMSSGLLWCYYSQVTLSSEPSACIIFKQLFCV